VDQPAKQRWVMHDSSLGRDFRPKEELRPVSMIASSCTHVAFWALKQMGCDPIIFVGLDLALDNGRQYSDGCEGWTPTQGRLEVDGYHGEKVETLSQYNVFRDQFELVLTHPDFRDLRTINATEGGAKIKGTEQLTLEEVIAELASADEHHGEGGIVEIDGDLPLIVWGDVVEELDRRAENLDEARESAKQAIKMVREAIKAFKAGDEGKMQRRGRAAAKRGKRSNEVITEDEVLSGRWMAAQNKQSARHEREASYLEDDPYALMRHNLAHYLQLLTSVEEGSTTLRPLYEGAAKRIREAHDV
jgi:hypothetical protein